MPSRAIVVPPLVETMEVAREALQDLVIGNFEFARRLSEVTGQIFVYPFRLCDGGHIVLRAKVGIRVANLCKDQGSRETLPHAGAPFKIGSV